MGDDLRNGRVAFASQMRQDYETAMQQRLPALFERPIAFAHRGARAHAPENTLEAFRLALKLGATGLESDVWLTADGIAVLDHDGVVKTRLRKVPIAEVPRSSLPAHIPSLEEFVDALGLAEDPIDVSLDVKDPAAGPAVIAVITDMAPSMLPHTWLCHPRWEQLLPWRVLSADVKLVDSTRLSRLKEGPERRAQILADHGIDVINMHHTDWTGGLVTLFHRFEVAAFSWDLQFDEGLRTALRMGVDGIYSDWVDRMMDAYAAEVG